MVVLLQSRGPARKSKGVRILTCLEKHKKQAQFSLSAPVCLSLSPSLDASRSASLTCWHCPQTTWLLGKAGRLRTHRLPARDVSLTTFPIAQHGYRALDIFRCPQSGSQHTQQSNDRIGNDNGDMGLGSLHVLRYSRPLALMRRRLKITKGKADLAGDPVEGCAKNLRPRGHPAAIRPSGRFPRTLPPPAPLSQQAPERGLAVPRRTAKIRLRARL